MGVEFAGVSHIDSSANHLFLRLFLKTAVTSPSLFGQDISPGAAEALSQYVVTDEINTDLHWSEGSYRGFYTLTVSPSQINATYWAMSDIKTFNLDAFPSAIFTVQAGEYTIAMKTLASRF